MPMKKEKKKQQGRVKAFEENKEKLVTLHSNLITLVEEYKKVFSSQSAATLLAKIEQVEEEDLLQAMVEKIHVVTLSDDEIDEAVTWRQVQESEDIFRGILRVLQDTISASLSLNKFEGKTKFGPCLQLAALALKKLVTLRIERSLLVERTKALQSQSSDDSSATKATSIKGFVSSILGKILGSGGGTTEAVDSSLMAHEDADIGLSLSLFEDVISAIEEYETYQADQDAIFAAATHLIELLDYAPTNFSPGGAGVSALEMLARVGTLESARVAYRFFQEGPNPESYRFSSVLRAYVEATNDEENEEVLKTIARECYEAVESHWENAFPSHRIERLIQCEQVLRCFSLANMGLEPGMLELVDNLIERALGSESYNQLMQDVASNTNAKASIDIQILPILNYLVHIFASSNDPGRIQKAKQILNSMRHTEREGLGGSIVYPNVDTFNCVINTIVEQYEKNKIEANDSARDDLELASSFLDYMLLRSEPGCLPNDESFLLMFRLIRAVDLDDMSDWAERLLAKMEVRQSLSKSNRVQISLSIYHRVLGCLLEGAKSGTADRACERAMKLLERLEVQSLPLFLGILDTKATKVQNLYNTELCPTERTYKLLLRICAETTKPSEKQVAADIAQAVIERMIQLEMLSEKKEAVDLFRACLSSLPDESSQRSEGEMFLKHALTGKTNLAIG